jgi:hypothetical protein
MNVNYTTFVEIYKLKVESSKFKAKLALKAKLARPDWSGVTSKQGF